MYHFGKVIVLKNGSDFAGLAMILRRLVFSGGPFIHYVSRRVQKTAICADIQCFTCADIEGQLISKCVIVWTNKPTKYFEGFLP